MDFKDWKKTKEDKHGVEMAHPKGHSMYILYKGVPAIQREALKRLPLAKGGEVKGIHKSSMDVERPDTSKSWNEKRMAGRSVAGDAVSDVVPNRLNPDREEKQNNQKQNQKAKDEHHRVLGEMKAQPNPKLKGLAHGGMAHYDQGTDDHPVSADDAKPQPPVVVNVGQPSTAAQQGSTNVGVQQPNVQRQNPNVLLPNGSMSAPGAAQTGQQAIQEQQEIDTAKAKAMVPIEQAKLQAQTQQAQQDQDNINALRTHADTMAQNFHAMKDIDPKAYLNNMSAPSKVATGLGLFLGGFSVPFGGHNFAADFLNKNIDRDIDAQKTNNENQKTIWGAYNQLYGNQNIASSMAKKSMADIYSNQVDQLAATLGTPQAYANAQKLKAALAITGNKAILEAQGNLKYSQNNPTEQSPQSRSLQPGQVGSAPGPGIIPASTGAQDQQPQEKPLLPKDDYADSPLLEPGAQNILNGRQTGSPSDRQNYPEAFKQYTQAQQADTILDQLHDVMGNLGHAAKEGGTTGYIRRHDPSATIPVVGHALSNMFIQPASDTQNNREYDSNKTRLVSDIANALRGTNVGGEAIQKIVDDNTPEHGDTPKMIAQKERNIRIFIKNSVPKSLLKDWKLSK